MNIKLIVDYYDPDKHAQRTKVIDLENYANSIMVSGCDNLGSYLIINTEKYHRASVSIVPLKGEPK